MWYAGIDAGSRAIKVVLWDSERGAVAARAVCDQGIRQADLAAGLLEQALAEARLQASDLAYSVATGYGRSGVDVAEAAVTEITCHARGVRALRPDARLVIDIGGQDSKVIWIDDRGGVRDFAMNDRCAAGTGRFLEVVAGRLETDITGLGAMAVTSVAPVPISSTCVVFAETEIIGLLASHARPEDLAAGVQHAIAARIAAMVGRRSTAPVLFAGGVALVPGMAAALSGALGHPVETAADPQYTGALGAALIASETAPRSHQEPQEDRDANAECPRACQNRVQSARGTLRTA